MLYNCFGLQTMWIRNKLVETSESSFYIDFLNDARKFGWCDESWHTDKTGVWNGDSQIIKFQSLSTFSNRRGAAHPDVALIIIDEFCPEDRKYPKNAVTGLMSLTKTVFAGRTDARVLAFSNIVSAANPYFAKLEIYPSREDITLFPDKLMLIERCKGYRCSIETNNPWNKVYKAARYDDYADESEDTLLDLIAKVPKTSRPSAYAILKDGKYYRPFDTPRFVVWSLQKNQPSGKIQIYAAEINEVSDNVPLMPKGILRDLQTQIENNTVRFETPNVMYQILSMLYDV